MRVQRKCAICWYAQNKNKEMNIVFVLSILKFHALVNVMLFEVNSFQMLKVATYETSTLH